MTYDEAVALIEEHTDYGGSLDKHALAIAISTEAAAGEPGITGPLRDDQRQRAISLYMSLPHSWESAESVITMVSASAYANGAHDAAPLRDEIRDHLNTAPPTASGQKLTDEQRETECEKWANSFVNLYNEPVVLSQSRQYDFKQGFDAARALLRASSATVSDKE